MASQLAATSERKLSITSLSSENNLAMFRLNAPVAADDDWNIQLKHRQVISELKLVTDNLFSI